MPSRRRAKPALQSPSPPSARRRKRRFSDLPRGRSRRKVCEIEIVLQFVVYGFSIFAPIESDIGGVNVGMAVGGSKYAHVRRDGAIAEEADAQPGAKRDLKSG